MSKYEKMTDEQKARFRERNRKRNAKNRDLIRKRKSEDLNAFGVTKNYVRILSRCYLFSNHTKLEGYEVHHCFGYEDPKKFIYIPKSLHTRIHKLLVRKDISADTNHWMSIRELVNSCDRYTYISV